MSTVPVIEPEAGSPSLEEASPEQLTQFIQHLSSEAEAGHFDWLPVLPDLMGHVGHLMSTSSTASEGIDNALAGLVERVSTSNTNSTEAKVGSVALEALTEASHGANPLDHAIMAGIDAASLKERPQLLSLTIKSLSPDYAYLLCLETDTEPPAEIMEHLETETREAIEGAHEHNKGNGVWKYGFLDEPTPLDEQAKYLRHVKFVDSDVDVIPAMPLLKSLEIRDCQDLTELTEELPSCTDLTITDTRIERIQTDLPKCTRIEIEDCSYLQLFTSHVPACTHLEISECQDLTAIPVTLEQCVTLSLYRLDILTSIPPTLENCEHLSLRYLPCLFALPEDLPADHTLEGLSGLGRNMRGNSLVLAREELAEHPAEILINLSECLLEGKGALPRVEFLGEQGIDAGGLKRDLVATLAQNLAANKAGQKLAFEKRAGGVIPKLVASSGEKRETEKKHLHAFADLLAAVYKDDTVTIGNVLAPTFFEALSLLNNEDYTNDEIALRIAAADILMPKIGDILAKLDPARRGKPPTPLTDEELFTVQEWAEDILGDEAPAKKLQECEKEVFKEIAAEALDLSQPLDAFIEVAKRLREVLGPATWQQATQLPAAELAVKIQGSLEAKDISEKLSPIGSGDTVYNFAETDSSDEAKTFRNLKAWVEDTARTKKELRGFLKAMTASPALIPGEDLKIRLFHADSDDKLPTAHTCFFQLDLPTNYADDPALFEQKLKLFIDNAEGFQFA